MTTISKEVLMEQNISMINSSVEYILEQMDVPLDPEEVYQEIALMYCRAAAGFTYRLKRQSPAVITANYRRYMHVCLMRAVSQFMSDTRHKTNKEEKLSVNLQSVSPCRQSADEKIFAELTTTDACETAIDFICGCIYPQKVKETKAYIAHRKKRRDILTMYFMYNMTLKEIGQTYGCCTQNISRIINECIQKLTPQQSTLLREMLNA